MSRKYLSKTELQAFVADAKAQSRDELRIIAAMLKEGEMSIRNHYRNVEQKWHPNVGKLTLGEIQANGGDFIFSDDGKSVSLKIPYTLIRGDHKSNALQMKAAPKVLQSTFNDGDCINIPLFNSISVIDNDLKHEMKSASMKSSKPEKSNVKKKLANSALKSNQNLVQTSSKTFNHPASGQKLGASRLVNVNNSTIDENNTFKTPFFSASQKKRARKPMPNEEIITLHYSKKGTPLIVENKAK